MDDQDKPIIPHSAMTYAELRQYNRQISGLDQFARARLRQQNRAASTARKRAKRQAAK